jgi:nitrate/nitrite transporter NarK
LIGSDSARGIFWVIPTRFLADRAAAGGLAFINSLGALGGFVGPYLVGVIKQSSGSFAPAALALSGFLVLSAILSAVLLVILRRVADGQRAVDINPVTATGEAA